MAFKALNALPCCPIYTTDSTDVGAGTAYPDGLALAEYMSGYWKAYSFECDVTITGSVSCYDCTADFTGTAGPETITRGPAYTTMTEVLCDPSGAFTWNPAIDTGGDPSTATYALSFDLCDVLLYNGNYYPNVVINGSITFDGTYPDPYNNTCPAGVSFTSVIGLGTYSLIGDVTITFDAGSLVVPVYLLDPGLGSCNPTVTISGTANVNGSLSAT